MKNITDAPINVQKRNKEEVYAQARVLLKKMGLETKEEYEYLKNLGATYYQGFYFAKPLDIGIITEKIEIENRLQV